jgi:4-amino-4-deoxy-L-arabinose transferase-like glycosyltransferase
LLVALPAAKLLIHLLFYRGYGWFRDELYYLASTDHLGWGYVDHPPLSIWLLAPVRVLFGDSRLAVRLLPALVGAAAVLVVGLIARRLGGGRLAEALAMLSAIAAPVYLGLSHTYSMNVWRLLFWALAAYLVVRILERDDPPLRLWVLLGVVLGLGLMNKISVLWLGAGLAVGLLLTPARRRLATPGPWIAGGLSALLFSPYVLWQIAHGWPTLEFLRNATQEKMTPVPFAEFVSEQVLALQPVTLPVWLAGLVFFFATARGRRFRVLGWTWLTVFVILALSHSARVDYIAPAYTWLFAAGGVAIEGWLAGAQRLAHPLRVGIAAFLLVGLVAGLALTAPFGLPVLSEERFIAYSRALGVAPSTDENLEIAELPQFYADMHGWEELVETLARIVHTLPPEDQARAVIFAQNYGEAGAVDVLGRRLGLPPALSGHNSYWLWGPERLPAGRDGSVVLVIGDDEETLGEIFEQVERVGETSCRGCMPYENGRPLWLCRGMKVSFEELWPRVKEFI